MSFQQFQQRYDLLGCQLFFFFTSSKFALTDRNCIPPLWRRITRRWLIAIAPPLTHLAVSIGRPTFKMWAAEQRLGRDEARWASRNHHGRDACQWKHARPKTLVDDFTLTLVQMRVRWWKSLRTSHERVASLSSLLWFWSNSPHIRPVSSSSRKPF